VLFYVLFVCKCVMPPGDNPIAVNPLNAELNPICHLHLVFVDAVDVVVCTPDDGWKYYPKHVEQFPDINKLCNVASCWIYIGILLEAHPFLHISRIRVNIHIRIYIYIYIYIYTTSILQPITLGIIATFEPVIYSRLRHLSCQDLKTKVR
jgi:hypothetical protein